MTVSKSVLTGIAVGLLFFLIGYIEETTVGPLKISILWKSAILIALAAYFSLYTKGKWTPQLFIGTAIALKSLFYVYTEDSMLITDFAEATKFLILPIAIATIYSSTLLTKNLEKIQLFFAIWIPASTVPFFLGLAPLAINESYDLAIYGQEGKVAFAGVFNNNSHVAAVTLACSIILQLHLLHLRRINRLAFFVLSTISLIALYLTYARTGWLSLVGGLVVYSYLHYPLKKFIYSFISGTVLLWIVGTSLYNSSEIFRNRLLGTNAYAQEVSLNQAGSGRFEIWQNAVQGPISEGPLGVLIGIGLDRAKSLMLDAYGMRIFSHNFFLDAYQTSGAIGLLLVIVYVFMVYRIAAGHLGSRSSAIAMALFAQFLLVLVVQGGTFFWTFLIFGLSIGFKRNKDHDRTSKTQS